MRFRIERNDIDGKRGFGLWYEYESIGFTASEPGSDMIFWLSILLFKWEFVARWHWKRLSEKELLAAKVPKMPAKVINIKKYEPIPVIELPECDTCNGDRFLEPNGHLTACPDCNQ